LKKTAGFENFRAWGEGYAALTYSLRDKDLIVNYIKKQREHHSVNSFKEEYIDFIKEMGQEWDERNWEK
jgi:hypothetical protein